jgi:hypothetical protein
VLRVAKINCAPAGAIGIVERKPSKYQTVTVGLFESAHRSDEEQRARVGAALRGIVARCTGDGGVTPTTLQQEHASELLEALGLKKRDIKAAIDRAVEDGYVAKEPRKGKGGGEWLILGNVVPFSSWEAP